MCINFSAVLQGVDGREDAIGPQVKTRGPELPADGPDDATRLNEHNSSEG